MIYDTLHFQRYVENISFDFDSIIEKNNLHVNNTVENENQTKAPTCPSDFSGSPLSGQIKIFRLRMSILSLLGSMLQLNR